ncbi:GDYXXLXY domain-containing protein [Ramlibacter humi]|uniref:DUF4401 domain-containing protein n=1 Tax=Ramlibacter humi TaxID=2530451 RepID=A0A4Z0BLN1_9BURK|nr:GDYXXLXY domain-containing protein [Ramlibacter humi]TFZ00236.1 DUF4401 domain-containing protein [Ramlibacter humi]
MTTAVDRALRFGVERGLLPREAAVQPSEARPWPVVLLTALGAWLAAMPLLFAFGALFGPFISKGVGAYLVGTLALAAAAMLLRADRIPVFVEQIAFPVLLAGGGLLAMGLYRDLPVQLASFVLLAISLGLARLLPKPWLRVLLGATAGGLFVLMFVDKDLLRFNSPLTPVWAGLSAALLAWGAGLWLQGRADADTAATLEAAGAGWLLQSLAGLAWWSGMTFLVGGTLGGSFAGEIARDVVRHFRGGLWPAMQAGSVLFALAGAVLAARAWPGLRRPAWMGVALVLAALCWFLPALGGTLFALALTATSGRPLLAAAAGVAAAWIVGAFYYQLQWPLAQKALVLAGAGAVLAALAWSVRIGGATVRTPARLGVPAALVAASAVITLGVANFAIWQKEDLIANGRRVYVALAPVDPRSLMQGDYMQLNWPLPRTDREPDNLATLRRPQLIARLDAQGIAQPLRVVTEAAALAADEMRIELTPRGGRWMLVTDAWFFREGDADTFARARYGEFRVLPDGRALLVGLADEKLQRLGQAR